MSPSTAARAWAHPSLLRRMTWPLLSPSGGGGLASSVLTVSVLRVRVRVGRRVGRFLIHVTLDDYSALVALVDWSTPAAAFGSGTVGPFIRRRVAQVGV